MTTAEKLAVPLSCFALNLMICSLGRSGTGIEMLMIGTMMRASIAEIFGSPNRDSKVPHDPKDLSCSRLQSELYREFEVLIFR